MEYVVSDTIKERLNKVLEMPEVKDALEFIESEKAFSTEEQIQFCLTESPTFHEDGRDKLLVEKFNALGVEGVFVDDGKSVEGKISGTEKGDVIMEAHIDTVFQFGAATEVRRDGDMLYAPGIYDNARGICCMLAFLRALKRSGIKTRKNLIVAGTSREEADGGLGGMRDLIDRHSDALASVSVDGGFMHNVTFNATYNKAVRYTFKGKGGHAFGAFGLVANPAAAAARAVVKIEDIQVPEKPRTTYAATRLYTPDYSGITAIPDACTLVVNYRSDGAQPFEVMEKAINAAIDEACAEETARWGKDTITVEKELLLHLPGGNQDMYSPLVQANYLCAQYIGAEPQLRFSGNSNSNIPISRGIPAVTVGNSRYAFYPHSLSECFCTAEAFKCPQGLFLLMLLVLGVDGGIESLY